MALGKYQKAVELMQPETLFAREDVVLTACLGHAQARSRHREDAEQILHRLQKRRQSRYTSPFFIAVTCIGLGQHDETMRWLETAYEERDRCSLCLTCGLSSTPSALTPASKPSFAR